MPAYLIVHRPLFEEGFNLLEAFQFRRELVKDCHRADLTVFDSLPCRCVKLFLSVSIPK